MVVFFRRGPDLRSGHRSAIEWAVRIVRGLSLAAAGLLGAPPLVFGLPTSDSAVTATPSSPASVFPSDILDPPASFSAGRPCPPGATVAPTFRSRSTPTSATGAGSLTVSAPSGIAAGDMVIAAVILDESDTSGWGGGGWGGGGGGYGGGGYGGGGYGGGGWNV